MRTESRRREWKAPRTWSYLNYLFDHDLLVIFLFVLMISHDYQIRHIDNASQVIRISWIWKYRWHLAASSHVGWGPGTVIPHTCCQCPADKTGGRSRRHAAFFQWGSSECAERNQNEESFRPKKQEIRMQLTVFFTDILRIYKSIINKYPNVRVKKCQKLYKYLQQVRYSNAQLWPQWHDPISFAPPKAARLPTLKGDQNVCAAKNERKMLVCHDHVVIVPPCIVSTCFSHETWWNIYCPQPDKLGSFIRFFRRPFMTFP